MPNDTLTAVARALAESHGLRKDAPIEALKPWLRDAKTATEAVLALAKQAQAAQKLPSQMMLVEALRFYAREQSWRSSSMYMCGHSGDTQASLDGGAKARAALSAPKEGERDGVFISRQLYDFLMGVGEIDGTGFGELNEGLPGRYWWRALLRTAALSAPKEGE